ncbi:MAG: hypothetical protein ACLQAH_04400 [Limisphaerales bacterium]
MAKSALRWSKASGSTKRRVEIIMRRGHFRRRAHRATADAPQGAL